jgi:putative transposase
MEQAREYVLEFIAFPTENWRKIWSTNPLQRLNKMIKRRTRVGAIFLNHPSVVRLVWGSCRSSRRQDDSRKAAYSW